MRWVFGFIVGSFVGGAAIVAVSTYKTVRSIEDASGFWE